MSQKWPKNANHEQPYWICEAIELGNIKVTYVPTDDNITDLFTKALPCSHFKKLEN